MRSSTALRAAAVAAVAAGLAAPLVRRRLRLPPAVVTATAATSPVALCILFPRSLARDTCICAAQMWAYTWTYKMPNDDPAELERRVRVDYPVRFDRWVGRGTAPTLRLQRRLGRPGAIRTWEKFLIFCHWVWFAVPHGTVAYLLLFRRDRFQHGAGQIYATFDLGVIGYWAIPTAPPWYASEKGVLDSDLRRMMVEYGERFWGRAWGPLYRFVGGNPLAAMPSLHFATSVMAARQLAATGRLAGTIGWAYAGTLGFALIYLGEHYVIDLAAGLALTELIRRGTPIARPALRGFSEAVHALQLRAQT